MPAWERDTRMQHKCVCPELQGGVVELVGSMLCDMWQRQPGQEAPQRAPHTWRHSMPPLSRNAGVHGRTLPCALRNVALQRLDGVQSLVRHRFANALAQRLVACTAWWLCVSVQRADPAVQSASVPQGMRGGFVGWVGIMHQELRCRVAAPPAHYATAATRRHRVPCKPAAAGLQYHAVLG
jgi:hypothetical protein